MKRSVVLAVAIFSCLLSRCVVEAQNLQMKVTYICNGERLIIDGCDIHDMSDTAHCFVAHPDRPLHNDMMAYTNETRGGLNKLIPTCKQPGAAEVKAHEDFERRVAASQQAAVDQQKAWVAAHSPQPQGPSEDQQAVNRCVSAGRSLFDCLGETMKKEVGDMLGAVDPSLKKMMTTEPGLRLSGVYNGAGFGLLFPQDQDTVILRCDPLVADPRPYTIINNGSQVIAKVENQPQPLIFTYKQGGLIGPGVSTVSGRVVVGTRHWTRVWSDGRREPMSEPIYEARTARCNAGMLPLAGPAPKVGLGAITDLGLFQTSEKSVTGSKDFKVSPGLRLIGDYVGPTGFNVEFRRESAVVGCGQAVAAHSYTIQLVGNQLLAKIGEDASPIVLALQPDGRISGSGQVHVAGRQIQGTQRDANDNEHVVFGATSGNCAIGTLALKGASPSEFERGANAARASLGPVGANGGVAPTPSARPVAQAANYTGAPKPNGGLATTNADQYYKQGEAYLLAKDYMHGAEAYRKAIALQPNMTAAYYGIALCYDQQSQWPAEAAAWKQYFALGGRSEPNAYLLLGNVDQRLKKHQEALEAYGNAIRLKPEFGNSAAVRMWIGDAYYETKQYEKAAPEYLASVRIKPDQIDPMIRLGISYLMLDRLPDAEVALQRATRLEPKHVIAQSALGTVYVNRGKKAEAMQVYKTLLALDKSEAQQLYADINKMK